LKYLLIEIIKLNG